jgi:hypothetical protein
MNDQEIIIQLSRLIAEQIKSITYLEQMNKYLIKIDREKDEKIKELTKED